MQDMERGDASSDAGYAAGSARGSRREPLVKSEESHYDAAAEAEARRSLQNASADARREHRELLQKLRDTDEEFKSTLGGYSSTGDEKKSSRDRLHRPPLISSPGQTGRDSTGDQAGMTGSQRQGLSSFSAPSTGSAGNV